MYGTMLIIYQYVKMYERLMWSTLFDILKILDADSNTID